MAGIFDDIKNKISDFFDEVKHVADGFGQLGDRLGDIGAGFRESGQGIKHEFVNLGHSVDLGRQDIGRLLQIVGELVYNSLRCGYHKLHGLRCCFIFYIMAFLGRVFYLIVPLTVYILRTCSGIDLRERVRLMHKSLETTDGMVHDVTGFHFIHFPDSVRQKCFTCPGNFTLTGSINAMKQQSEDINYDFKHTIPDLLNEPAKDFRNAATSFRSAFT